jgi:predicted acyltransferase
MIIVNTPGSGATPFAPLEHADWHGFTVTDLVFPSFLFAVGNSISFSSRNKKLSKILKRTLLIYLIGYFLNWFVSLRISSDWSVSMRDFWSVRVLGVLPRIAIAYGIAAILALYFSDKQMIYISAFLLIGYWIILKVFGDPGLQYTLEGNAVRKLDLAIIGPERMYKQHGIPFDPEGILSTMSAVVNVTLGYLTGKFIQAKGKTYECIGKLLVAGNLLILLALVWDLEFPINKKLWTSSFALYTSGIAMVIIGVLLYFYELRQTKAGSYFFQVFGRNPLFIYILADVFIVLFWLPVGPDLNFYGYVNNVIYQRIAPGPVGSLLFAISFALLCWVVGYFLDKRKIYIRV